MPPHSGTPPPPPPLLPKPTKIHHTLYADTGRGRGRQGRTVLHAAALAGPARMVSFLLEVGADPTLPDDAGKVRGP